VSAPFDAGSPLPKERIVTTVPTAPKEKIKLFAWWLHTHAGKELFSPADIRGCYDRLHIDEPPALATYLTRMAEAKDVLKEKGQYKLARAVRSISTRSTASTRPLFKSASC
jgi:hypothetical protein